MTSFRNLWLLTKTTSNILEKKTINIGVLETLDVTLIHELVSNDLMLSDCLSLIENKLFIHCSVKPRGLARGYKRAI